MKVCFVVWLFGGFVVLLNAKSAYATTKQPDNKTTKQQNNKYCLEDNTERSESNPGRSLGIYDTNKNGCLEDSTLHWVDTYAFGTVFQTAFFFLLKSRDFVRRLLLLRSVKAKTFSLSLQERD